MTYSHRIDPRKPLCRRELEGGACNYSYCEYQHFRDLTLTGMKRPVWPCILLIALYYNIRFAIITFVFYSWTLAASPTLRTRANVILLTLADNNILLELGSVHEGTTKQEQQGYIDGLKQIISGMRDRNLKDVSAVASEIVAYRANFLGDASRVLTSI